MKSPLKLVIARDIITSQVAAYLQSINVIPSSTEVISIEFGDLSKNLPGYNEIDKEIVPITVHFKEEVKLTYYGDATP